ncbi:lantibiotic dehydratase [Paraherbaspirillum soli]|uniref:Lantibiotic dehydratase n=1 Tax=Paraherbaspirillum soli TaxID=631222 RepID=A0ABW0MC18_9BURK
MNMQLSSYFWIRSAGFPISWLERFAVHLDDAQVAHADALRIEIDARIDRIRDALLQAGSSAALKIVRKLKDGTALNGKDWPAGQEDLYQREVAPLYAAQAALAGNAAALEAQFKDAAELSRRALFETLTDPLVREAVFLSNPSALERLTALADSAPERVDNRMRQRLRLAWSYIQRLCAKNDTTSFFGPIAWGEFRAADAAADAQSLSVVSSPGNWIAERRTYFEHWVVSRVADCISQDAVLSEALPIYLSAACVLVDGALHVPANRRIAVGGASAAVLTELERCRADGVRRAELHSKAVAAGFTAQEVDDAIDGVLEKRVARQGVRVGTGLADPLGTLRDQLAGLRAAPARVVFWNTLLDQLEVLRQRFAAGDLALRQQTMACCEQLLADNGVDVNREHGKMYVGRFPFYEDCARNVQASISGALLGAIRQDLMPLMRLYDRLAGAVASELMSAYLDIRAGCGADTRCDFLSFAGELQRHRIVEGVIQRLRPVLRTAWQSFAGETTAVGGEIVLASHDLERLFEVFDRVGLQAHGALPLGATVHSPDFFVAAASVAAINAGDFDIVIGEVHPTVHTVSQPVAQPFCPFNEQIRAEVSALFAGPRLVAADSDRTYQRSHIDWPDVAELWQVELPGASARVPGERRVPAGRLAIVACDDVLYVEDCASGRREHFLTVLPGDLHRACFALAADVLGAGVGPRIRHGRTICKRRTWEMRADGLPSVERVAESAQGFLAWRRWAAEQQLPRYVFVKADTEPKPVFVDFCCPLSLDALASIAARAEILAVSEMLPTPDQAWLADERGNYCTEFRTSISAMTAPSVAPIAAENRMQEPHCI